MSRSNSMLEEWKMTYEATMQFNDLLMRLRTLGLPAMITVTGAGFVGYLLMLTMIAFL